MSQNKAILKTAISTKFMKSTKTNQLLSILFLSFATFTTYCQNTIRGKVYDVDNGQPIGFADIIVEGSTSGTNTDVEGFYSLSGLGNGTIKITARFLGFESKSIDINLKGGVSNQNFYLKQSGILLNEVDVTGRKEISRTQVQIAKVTVTPREIKALPSLGGEPDVAQYLQVIPGVVSTGDQGGQLFIRGGAPVQNKILLDGLNIYNPFHSLGLFSSFETDVIRNVDVYTAGFDAEYGGRTSAIIDIQTREGNKTRLAGFASVSPFAARGMIEAPLKKFEEGKGNISLMLTGKKAIISQTDDIFYNYASVGDSIGLPFDFTDFYGKLSIGSQGGSKFNFFGFKFNDLYNNPQIANIGWDNLGFGADFKLIPANSSLIIDGVVGATNYTTEIIEGNDQPRESKIREISGDIGFSYYGKDLQAKYGFDFRAISTDFAFTNPFGSRLNQNQNTSEIAAFVKFTYNLNKKIIIEPSFRVMYYAAQRRLSPEPRFGAKVNFTNDLRFRLGGGLYSQNILSTSNDRDIVNLFNGFLTGPEEQVTGLDGQNLTNKLLLARHAVAGFEYDVTKSVIAMIEGYYKDFPQVIVVNRNKLSNSESNYSVEEGWAYGIDFSLKVNKSNYDIWSTYSHGYVRRDDGRQVYPTVFDRRHNVNLVLNYFLNKSKNTFFGFRWNFGSGFPFTQTRGFYNNQVLGAGQTTYPTSNPTDFGVIFSSTRNGGRLPDYHRLDLSFTHIVNISKYIKLDINASLVNAYDRNNIFYFDRIRYSRVEQLPIIPSLSTKLSF
jgi:hypothetical protein